MPSSCFLPCHIREYLRHGDKAADSSIHPFIACQSGRPLQRQITEPLHGTIGRWEMIIRTFKMSGVTPQAKPAVARPLDGGVRPQSHRRTWPLYAMYSAPKRDDSTCSSGLIWKRLMYSTKMGTNRSATGLNKKTAQAKSVTSRPRYMGLRVKR